MRRRRRCGRVFRGLGLLVTVGATALPIAAAATSGGLLPPASLVPPCDPYNPASPAASARIALDSGDLVERRGGEREMRSFVATGSLGRVEVALVQTAPPGVVRAVSAVPAVSRLSPYFGERLKGIALDVALAGGSAPVRVVVELRQVCAGDFRKTFLYY